MKKLISVMIVIALVLTVAGSALADTKQASLYVSSHFQIGEVSPYIFGGYCEGANGMGFFDPNHPSADEDGFLPSFYEGLKEAGVSIIRYPGGNFTSGYHWRDGVGPVEERPTVLDRSWGMPSANRIGIDEYYKLIGKIGAAPMLTVNLGTGTPEEAADEVEYCNYPGGTDLSEMRKKNGIEESQNIKIWSLGNELDGPWEIGQKTPEEYGRIAYEAAKQMKKVDPTIQLVVCGSSNNEIVREWLGDWETEVLSQTYDLVDYISIHKYSNFDQKTMRQMAADNGNYYPDLWTIEDLSAIPVDYQRFIDCVNGSIQSVKGKVRSDKDIYISFDEWSVQPGFTIDNPEGLVWDDRGPGFGFTLASAIMDGALLMTFINNADTVKIANFADSLAMVGEGYHPVLFYPFSLTSHNAKGVALQQDLDCSQAQVQTDNYGMMDAVYTASVYNKEAGELVVFAVNYDLRNEVNFDISSDFSSMELIEHVEFTDPQALTMNSPENPERVVPVAVEGNTLKALSWNMFRFKVE